MSLLCIDIESEFGAFNKPFSNTGGLLTFMIPPKTAIIGLLGATVGYGLRKTLETFRDTKVGVEPLKNIETKTITYLCHYGYGGHPDRERRGIPVNIKQELIVRPQYRLYIEVEAGAEAKNKQLLRDINKLLLKTGVQEEAKDVREGLELLFRNHISYYSLYMGKNDFPLRYSLIDIKTNKRQPTDMEKYFPTNCAVPRDGVSNPKITVTEENFGGLKIKRKKSEPFSIFIISNVPFSQTPDREFTEFKDLLLKDRSRETVMEVVPKRNDCYSFYTDEDGNLIVCF